MMGHASCGDVARGCIAITGRSVKRFAPAKWDTLEAKAKEVIDHFWKQPNAQKKYDDLCQKALGREKDYYL